eukprot:scaffold1466_cov385-Prasinococcus_capsulatus_cf.AAC.23
MGKRVGVCTRLCNLAAVYARTHDMSTTGDCGIHKVIPTVRLCPSTRCGQATRYPKPSRRTCPGLFEESTY